MRMFVFVIGIMLSFGRHVGQGDKCICTCGQGFLLFKVIAGIRNKYVGICYLISSRVC